MVVVLWRGAWGALGVWGRVVPQRGVGGLWVGRMGVCAAVSGSARGAVLR